MSGEQTEVNGADRRDGQNDVHGQREAGRDRRGDFGAGLAHVHHHNHANVVVRADDAVDGHDHSQPDQMRIDGGLENIELAEEAGGYGKAEERKQEEREYGSHPGLTFAEAGEVIELEVLFARTAELRNDGERADFHERIGQQIEKHRGVGGAGADFGVAWRAS